jgi:hypothetical protein
MKNNGICSKSFRIHTKTARGLAHGPVFCGLACRFLVDSHFQEDRCCASQHGLPRLSVLRSAATREPCRCLHTLRRSLWALERGRNSQRLGLRRGFEQAQWRPPWPVRWSPWLVRRLQNPKPLREQNARTLSMVARRSFLDITGY